jgi:hypothetical protein
MAAVQQILLGMGGSGSDSYWYGLYSWGSQSGNYANNFYYFNGCDIDPDDNIYLAGQKNRTHTYYDNAIFAKLDIDGALQAKREYNQGGNNSNSGGGVVYQQYSHSSIASGATQKILWGSYASGTALFFGMNVNTLECQGSDSVRVKDYIYYQSTLCGPPNGLKYSHSSSSNTYPVIYRAGNNGYINRIAFSNTNTNTGQTVSRDASSGQPGYSSNNATQNYQRIRGYANSTWKTTYWRGIDFIDDGSMNSGGSGSDYNNSSPYIVLSGDFGEAYYGQWLTITKRVGYSSMSEDAGISEKLPPFFNDGNSKANIAGQVKCDSSYNYHAFKSYNNTASQYVGGISKWSNSGTHQWTKALQDSSSNSSHEFNYNYVELRGITVDDDGNSYVVGSAKATSTRQVGVIAKINANGTIGWQNIFYKTSSNTNSVIDFKFVRMNSKGSLVAVGSLRDDSYPSPTYGGGGTIANYDQGLVIKVASDGSGTGTYGNYTYGTSSFDIVNWPYSWQSASLGGGYNNYQQQAQGYAENHDNASSDAITTTSIA